MWESSYRLAFVQLVYQYLFHLNKLPGIEVEVNIPHDSEFPEIDNVTLESEFESWKDYYHDDYALVEKYLSSKDKSYMLVESCLLAFLHENRVFNLDTTKYEHSNPAEESKKLIKKYLRIGDKLISGDSVNTIHAILGKISQLKD